MKSIIKLWKPILISILLLVSIIPIISISFPQPPQIETHLITKPSDYKAYNFTNVKNPYVYTPNVLSDAHLPFIIKTNKTYHLSQGFLKHYIAHQHGKRNIKYQYLLLTNQSYTVKVPIYKTIQRTINVTDNETGNTTTKIINTTVITGYKNETHYHWVWKPIHALRLEANKYYVFDIHGIIKPRTGKFSIDVVPQFNIQGSKIQLTQFAWWNSNWQYRKNLSIANASNDYQMKITVWKPDGHDDPANATIDTEGHCNDNFSDIRFANETTELSYWIESTNTSNYSIIWVKLPSDIESQATPYIYMYYNNSGAPSVSNGSNTWIYYETFTGADGDDPAGWTDPNSHFEIKSNTLYSSTSNNPDEIYITNSNIKNFKAFYDVESTTSSSSGGDYAGIVFRYNTTSGALYWFSTRFLVGAEQIQEHYYWDGSANTNLVSDSTSVNQNEWYKHEIYVYNDSCDFYVIDSNGNVNHHSFTMGNYITDAGKIGLGGWDIQDAYWDNFRVGKYVSPEPSWSSFGSEEVSFIPQISNPSPANGATNIIPIYNQGVNTSVYISQRDGKTMNITFYWNNSGVWQRYASWTNVSNGTYSAWNANFSAMNTTYQWAVNATNYGEPQNFTNVTYSFTTLDDILPWFIANEDSTSVTLDWGASPQADSYYIRNDTVPHSTWTPTTGTLLVNTTSHTFTHTGLAAGTTYYYALFIWNNTYGYSTEYKEDHVNTPYSSPHVNITNVLPTDNSSHVDIVNNPPDPGGYVPITFQLNDTDGGNDTEYWLDVFDWQTQTWVNRIHLTDQANQSVEQDEPSFNTTNTTYYFRIKTLEGGQYNNVTIKLTTDRKPNPPKNPYPANNSVISQEYVILSVNVSHPDYDYGARIYNVSFYTYPGGKLIGYNHSTTGFSNNTVVTCNTTYYAPYAGNTYYWYAVAYDDEYNTSSPVFHFSTYYNDTEPSITYFSFGADIYVNPPYTTPEPNITYYSVGAQIYVNPNYTTPEPNITYYSIGANQPVMYKPELKYEFPANDSTVSLGNTNIGIYSHKQGKLSNWLVQYFLRNSTTNFTQQTSETVVLGTGANNQTVTDNQSGGTLVNTTTNESGLILAKQSAEKTNTNYNANWQYYQILNINNNGYTGYYQMLLNVSYNGGGNVSCNNHCNANFSDLRFVQTDNTTELPYWIEKQVNSSYALVWVNVSATAMSDSKILMYYGNPSATSASNGSNTWIYYETFTGADGDDPAGWTDPNSHFEIKSNTLYSSTSNNPDEIYITNSNIKNFKAFYDVESTTSSSSSGDYAGIVFRYNTTSGALYWFSTRFEVGSEQIQEHYYWDGSANTNLVSDSTSVNQNEWYKHEIYVYNDSCDFYVIDSNGNVNHHSFTMGNYITDAGKIGLGGWAIVDAYWDNFRVGKYVSPEPSWSITQPYYPSGYRESPEFSLSGRAESTNITWNSTEPSGTSISVYYSLYNGNTWGGWQLATKGGAISGISDGTLLDGYKIKFRANLSTSDTSVTPLLHNITLNIDRYTVLSFTVDLTQIDTYQWYIYLQNDTTSVNNQTQIFTLHAYSYQEPEPNITYYSFGADITIIYPLNFTNPYPNNTITNINTQLKVDITKQGKNIGFNVYFETNDTSDKHYAILSSEKDIFGNKTISSSYYGLEPSQTYWWRVRFVNSSLQENFTSPVYSFTSSYLDIEPGITYFSFGAGIYVNPPYTTPEPNITYYSVGARIPVGIPQASDPFPADGAVFGQQAVANFSVYITDPNTATLTVTFYDASTSTAWYSTTTSNYSRAYAPKPTLTNGTWFEWYVTVADTNNNITSDTWSYKPENQPPQVTLKPQDGNNFVPVRRKLLSGAWVNFVRLQAQVSDVENDKLHVSIYVDDPSQPNWNDWVLRLNLADTSSGTFTQDEQWFDQPEKTYHWEFYVSDGYASETYYINFTTDFYFWSYFTYSPLHPTQEDTVHLSDQSVNATDIAWYVNGERIAYHNYSIGLHPAFNLDYTFNYSNVYNVSLWIHNNTCNNTDVWYETIYVDWNATLNTTFGGAGINYISCPLNTTSTVLATKLLHSGEWIHQYNTTSQSWDSIWLYNNTAIGDNFTVKPYDGIAVVVTSNRTTRINITQPINTTVDTTIPSGYNYIGWTSKQSIESNNLSSIGLHDGDWAYSYDTHNGTWSAYRVNFTGDLFKILSHKCVIVDVGGNRNIYIKG